MDYPVGYGIVDTESETDEAEYENVTDKTVSAAEEEVLPWRDAKVAETHAGMNCAVRNGTGRWSVVNSKNVIADFLSDAPRRETSKLISDYLVFRIKKGFRGCLREDDVEDAASDACISAYKDRKSFYGEFLTAWLNTIAFRAGARLYREQKKAMVAEKELKTRWEMESVPWSPGKCEAIQIGNEAKSHCLTAKEAQSIYFLEMGYSRQEAAEIVGCSANGMASRLSGALTKLRAYFRDVYEWEIPESTDGRTHRGKKSAQIKSDKKLEIENTPGIDKIEENRE